MLNHFGHVQLFATPWTVDQQAPLSMGFSRQEYWNGLPCPPPGDLPRDQTCISSVSCTGRRVLHHLPLAPSLFRSTNLSHSLKSLNFYSAKCVFILSLDNSSMITQGFGLSKKTQCE